MIILSKLWLANKEGNEMAKTILQKMVQVTMMRGAQSGGVVTFIGGHADDGMRDELKHKTKGLFGVRARVVNTKRGDLSVGVRSKLEAAEQSAVSRGLALRGAGRVYAGHTRFATTSKATFDGTHPHQWSPRTRLPIWSGFRESESPTRGERWVENYICHNGDFDFYTVGALTYDLNALQEWLPRATGHPMPAAVDSCAVAGMLDLLRAQGSWFLAARFAFHLGKVSHEDVSRTSLRYPIPSRETLLAVAAVFDNVFGERVRGGLTNSGNRPKTVVQLGLEGERSVLANEVAMALRAGGHAAALHLESRESTSGGADQKELESGATLLETFARSTVDAFFDNDLLFVARVFMANAKGSFGLCLTCSIDAHRQICLAARGQTISVAFYPRTGLVLYGSEQAAVKAALGVKQPKQKERRGSSGYEQAAASPGGRSKQVVGAPPSPAGAAAVGAPPSADYEPDMDSSQARRARAQAEGREWSVESPDADPQAAAATMPGEVFLPPGETRDDRSGTGDETPPPIPMRFKSSREPVSPAEKSPQKSSRRVKTKSFEQWSRNRESLEVWRQDDYEGGRAVRLDLDDLGGEASRVVGPT